jgi:hypothetical protein
LGGDVKSRGLAFLLGLVVGQLHVRVTKPATIALERQVERSHRIDVSRFTDVLDRYLSTGLNLRQPGHETGEADAW